MNWLAWGILLFIQNFSFTMVSRARNSGSLWYHAVASLFSNGVWFASQLILVDTFIQVIKTSDVFLAVTAGAFYTVLTLAGSLFSHWFLMKYIETGKRQVQ